MIQMPKTSEKREKYSTLNYIKNSVIWFYQKKKEFEVQKEIFEDSKKSFEHDMDKYYSQIVDENGEAKVNVKDELFDLEYIKVTKVSSVKLDFNVEGIKKLLSKADAKSVIKKSYTITDWPGLFNLLKSNGVSFSEFMKFASVTEEVIPEQIDRLVDLGKLDEADVRKNVVTRKGKTYYRLTGK